MKTMKTMKTIIDFQDLKDSIILNGIVIPSLHNLTVGIVSDEKSLRIAFGRYWYDSKKINKIEHVWYPDLYKILYSSQKYDDKIRNIYINKDGIPGILFVELWDGRFVVGTKKE